MPDIKDAKSLDCQSPAAKILVAGSPSGEATINVSESEVFVRPLFFYCYVCLVLPILPLPLLSIIPSRRI